MSFFYGFCFIYSNTIFRFKLFNQTRKPRQTQFIIRKYWLLLETEPFVGWQTVCNARNRLNVRSINTTRPHDFLIYIFHSAHRSPNRFPILFFERRQHQCCRLRRLSRSVKLERGNHPNSLCRWRPSLKQNLKLFDACKPKRKFEPTFIDTTHFNYVLEWIEFSDDEWNRIEDALKFICVVTWRVRLPKT